MFWNNIDTGKVESMAAETVVISGNNNDDVNTYYSRPTGEGLYPSIVLVPHMPGWDEFMRETARRFSQHGYAVACPDIFSRFGTGHPEEISKKAREAGGVPDESVMGDCQGAIDFLKAQPNSNGKVGIIGTCSGGRHAFMAACELEGIDAVVDCWGGGVVPPKEVRPGMPMPKEVLSRTKDLSCPMLGIFGNDDMHPTPEQVDIHEAELKKHGKDYTFHRYDGAGHGFWYYFRDMYRVEQTMDSWEKVLEFFQKHLKQ